MALRTQEARRRASWSHVASVIAKCSTIISEDHHSIFENRTFFWLGLPFDAIWIKVGVGHVPTRTLHPPSSKLHLTANQHTLVQCCRFCQPTSGVENIVQPPCHGSPRTPSNHQAYEPRLSQRVIRQQHVPNTTSIG